VFIHEAGFAMWGGLFYLPVRWAWTDFPANHQNGHNLSFADGHVEHWRWQDPNTLKTFARPVVDPNLPGYPALYNRDLVRLLKATPAWSASGGLPYP